MRRVIIPTVGLLLCSVVLGATVFREQAAQAAQAAQAILQVRVMNTTAEPVPVRQQGAADVNVTNAAVPFVDIADGQAKHVVTTGTVPVSSPNDSLCLTVGPGAVPAGKRWVVETLSFHIDVPNGNSVREATFSNQFAQARVFLPVIKTGSDANDDYYAATEQIRYYLDAGAQPAFCVWLAGGATGHDWRFEAVAEGYLVNAP
jgi:hypothetical protein